MPTWQGAGQALGGQVDCRGAGKLQYKAVGTNVDRRSAVAEPKGVFRLPVAAPGQCCQLPIERTSTSESALAGFEHKFLLMVQP